MTHALVCATGPLRVAIGGSVPARQPHLIDRINAGLIDSLGGYMPLPDDGPYVVAPQLGAMDGPLGAIAPAMGAEKAERSPLEDRKSVGRGKKGSDWEDIRSPGS